MKTIILTQKKYSINLKESATNLDRFIAEIFLLAKTLKEEKDKNMKLSQAAINPVDQTIEVTVTADASSQNSQSSSAPAKQSNESDQSQRQPQQYQQSRGQQPRNMPPRPNR
jgi:hypothetical protein